MSRGNRLLGRNSAGAMKRAGMREGVAPCGFPRCVHLHFHDAVIRGQQPAPHLHGLPEGSVGLVPVGDHALPEHDTVAGFESAPGAARLVTATVDPGGRTPGMVTTSACVPRTQVANGHRARNACNTRFSFDRSSGRRYSQQGKNRALIFLFSAVTTWQTCLWCTSFSRG